MRNSHIRVVILSLLVGMAFAFWWFKTPAPLVGGGQSDGPWAWWVKSRVYASVSPQNEAGFSRLTIENANGWYNVSREPIQSFDYYRNQKPPRPTDKRRFIVLQPVGPFTASQNALLKDLGRFCGAFFQLPVRLAPSMPFPDGSVRTKPKEAKNKGVGDKRYNADDMLTKTLSPQIPADAAAYLGITMADLWVDDLSFVFGLGGNRCGIYSLARYFPNLSRQPTPQEARLGLRRSCQVLDHEMGHILGLYHCVLYKCSMNGSNSLADADASPLDYCPVCHRKILWNTSADGVKRYRELLHFYRDQGLTDEAEWAAKRLENWQQIAQN
ncbi:hypothetical protein EON80_08625 [bacterium]|nr:MAG: hypothetical protein EON80_08625 [bacterium]